LRPLGPTRMFKFPMSKSCILNVNPKEFLLRGRTTSTLGGFSFK
jgi:hypothetical protein